MNIKNKKTALSDDAALYSHKEDVSEQEKWASMTGKERWRYFADYYLGKIVVTVIILAVVGSILYTILTPKPEVVLSVAVVEDAVKQQAPRTFHHLTGVCIEEALYNSDGEQIEGISIPKVILFNTDVITLEEVEELLQRGEVEFSDKVMIIPRCVAENLADI